MKNLGRISFIITLLAGLVPYSQAARDRYPTVPGLRVASEIEIGPDRYATLMAYVDMDKVLARIPTGAVPVGIYDRYLEDDPRAYTLLPESAKSELMIELSAAEKQALDGKVLLDASHRVPQGLPQRPRLILPESRPGLQTPKLSIASAPSLDIPPLSLSGTASPAHSADAPVGLEELRAYGDRERAAKLRRAAWDKIFTRWKSLSDERKSALVDPNRLGPELKAKLLVAARLPTDKPRAQTGEGWELPIRNDVDPGLRQFLGERMQLEYFPAGGHIEIRHRVPVESFDALEADEQRTARLVGAELWLKDPASRPEVAMSLHTHASVTGRDFAQIVDEEKMRIYLKRIQDGGAKAVSHVTGTSGFGYDDGHGKDVIRLYARERFEQRAREGKRAEQLRRLAWLCEGEVGDVVKSIRAEIARMITPESLDILVGVNRGFLGLLRPTLTEHPETHAALSHLIEKLPGLVAKELPWYAHRYALEHLDSLAARGSPLLDSALETAPAGADIFARVAAIYGRNPEANVHPRVAVEVPSIELGSRRAGHLFFTTHPRQRSRLMPALLGNAANRKALLTFLSELPDRATAQAHLKSLDDVAFQQGPSRFAWSESEIAEIERDIAHTRAEIRSAALRHAASIDCNRAMSSLRR